MILQQNFSSSIRFRVARFAGAVQGALAVCVVLCLGTASAWAQTTSAADSSEAGLLEKLQSRDRGFYSDELLQGNHTFRDTSIARFDSLGMKAWEKRADKNRQRFDFEYDPAMRLWTYQRVEGLLVAGGASVTHTGKREWTLLGQGGYAISSKKWRYYTSAAYRFDVGASSHTVLVDYSDRVIPFGSNRPTWNGLFALVAGLDERDYLRREGGEVSWWSTLGPHVGLGVGYDAGRETSVAATTDFSFFNEMDEPNPVIDDGTDRSVIGRARLRFFSRRLRLVLAHRVSGGGLGGDFTYNRTQAQLDWRFYAWRRQEIVTKFLAVRNGGTPTVQRLGDAGGLSTVRGYDRRTHVGEQSLAARAEWLIPYDLMKSMKIPGLRSLHLQFVPWGDAARVWNGDSDDWIHSAGLGIQKFLGAMGPVSNLRFDFAFPIGPDRPEDFRFYVQFTSANL